MRLLTRVQALLLTLLTLSGATPPPCEASHWRGDGALVLGPMGSCGARG